MAYDKLQVKMKGKEKEPISNEWYSASFSSKIIDLVLLLHLLLTKHRAMNLNKEEEREGERERERERKKQTKNAQSQAIWHSASLICPCKTS